ncbi:hypothetical protein BGZ68_005674 [Mortierella alpina]|nr:hypothetical protein BGZ68_005674 [Mortierella alpina]
MPTLPFVVLQTHKPSSTAEIIAATATAAAAATAASTATAAPGAATTGLSSSSVSSLKPPRSPTSPAPTSKAGSGSGATGLLPVSPGGTRPNSSVNHTHSLPGSSSTRARADSAATAMVSSTLPTPSSGPALGGATSSPPAGGNSSSSNSSGPSTLQIRTLHPQVHYIFENDPLETEILESVPKSQSITLDFDPRTGTIKNVESFLTHLQVMDVKLVPFQATLPALSTSSSATSLNSMMGGVNHNSVNVAGGDSQQQPHRSATAPTLGRTNSSGASSINSSMTTSATKMTRRPSERSLGNHTGTGGEGDDKTQAAAAGGGGGGGAGKDWTLVINAVEVDGKDLDSESEMLEQSMLSSFDTDLGPEESLAYSDALLKTFQTRNMLVRKVIDYTTSTSSAASTPQ